MNEAPVAGNGRAPDERSFLLGARRSRLALSTSHQ